MDETRPLQPPERRTGQTKDPATSKNLIPIHRAVAASLADRQQSLQSAIKTAFLEVSNFAERRSSHQER